MRESLLNRNILKLFSWQTKQAAAAAYKQLLASSKQTKLSNRCLQQTQPRLATSESTINFDMQRNKDYLLNLSNINQNVIQMEYAVRGPLVIRANEIAKEIASGSKKYPFDEVIRANIGDCHAMNQVPVTFIRQVIAACTDSTLLETNSYPEDVKERVRLLLSYCGGESVGSYSDSAGIEIIRRHCAEYITNRDGGVPADFTDIVLTTGASEAVRAVLTLINSTAHDDKPSGVMIPIPQYPLYTATLAEYGMTPINYYLDEDNQWSLDINELERAITNAKDECNPKAIVIINPGNPTGSVLTYENISNVIKFARREGLMVIADEVYQHNVYGEGAQFCSFKRVMSEMGEKIELASLMSASKGFMGECGLRGGYCEFFGLDPEVKKQFLKMLSARLCSSVLGQIALDCSIRPPTKGDASYEVYMQEKAEILKSLRYRAKHAADVFNSIPGMQSNQVAGAMYAFPRITIPPKAVEEAKKMNQAPDFHYAMQLLETKGICVVPGSGFGQRPGTYHFRTTILPQIDKLEVMMDKLKEFHLGYLKKYE